MGKRGIAGQKENGWTFPSLFSNVEFSYDTFSVREHGVSIGWRPLFLEILRSSCLLLDDVEPLDDALQRERSSDRLKGVSVRCVFESREKGIESSSRRDILCLQFKGHRRGQDKLQLKEITLEAKLAVLQ